MNSYPISVIVPMYKVERWLNRCVESIRNQTYADFELILVDDGSPDRCGAIADEYAAKDGRIKVIHRENGGLSSARNAGMNMATGKYIAFVDSDDYVSEDFLLHFYQTAERHRCDVVVCGYESMPSRTRVLTGYTPNKPMTGKELILTSHTVHSSNDLCFTPRFFFNAERMNRHRLRFNENILIAEDTVFNLEFLLKSERAMAVPTAPYFYTTSNPDSLMKSPYKPNLEKSLILQYAIRKQLSDEYSLLRDDRYRKDMADYYVKSILTMMKNNILNGPETDKLSAFKRILKYDMFTDSLKEIGLHYKCENYKEYLYYLALKFKIMPVLKREFAA